MAKRRRPKKRESPPEPAAADTALWPRAEEEAAEGAAEGGGGGRPFRVPLEPATQEQEAGAARREGGGGRLGYVSSRAARGPRRWGPGGRGQRGGGGGGSSRSHGHGFPASRLRPPRRRCRTACWERGAVPAPLEPGKKGGARGEGRGHCLQTMVGAGLMTGRRVTYKGRCRRASSLGEKGGTSGGRGLCQTWRGEGRKPEGGAW